MPVKVPYILNRLLRDRRDIVNLQDAMLSLTLTSTTIVTQSRLAYDGAAAIRAIVEYVENLQIFANYTTSPGDGTQGIFVYKAAETDPDDGVNIIIPSNNVSGSGAFVRYT